MKKSMVTAVFAVTASILLLMGCSGRKNGSLTSGRAEEITWMFWDDLETATDLMSVGYAQVIERFNNMYAGTYHVTPVTAPLEDYTTQLNALIAAGNCPDVFICNPGPDLTVYVDNGSARDITDLLKVKNSGWYASFTNGVFDRLTYSGRIMAVPVNFAAALVFYNTEIFDSAGVSVPATYDELIAVCKKLQTAGYVPLACAAATPWCLSMSAGYLCDRSGGPENLAGVAAGTADWLDPSFVDGVSKFKELTQYFQPTAAGDINEAATALFYNGGAAMIVQGSWIIGQITGANPDFLAKCGVFPFPAIPGGADPNRVIVKTDNLVMSSATKHEAAAVALMKMFTDDTAQRYTAEIACKIPVTTVQFDMNRAPALLGDVWRILAKSTGMPGFYDESFSTARAGGTFDNAMTGVFRGDCSVEEGLERVNAFFREYVWNGGK